MGLVPRDQRDVILKRYPCLYVGCMSTIQGSGGKRESDEPESKPDLIKVTVLLPEDTINKIDAMARVALLGSRGRTIQSLVDTVWDSKTDIGNIMSSVKDYNSKSL